ncbi:NarK family nitrate/nitrite MFS transporter [Streptomyces sp. SID8379]|uniref:NarK family nitrate/nitrite MFS transporter n=1 Tax=unclassified Streptomyces TaxID=2593676 RepID=UPI00036445B6|nr:MULTISPECIES: NarK family nitrate/nitrite MFS transporter [unclassified Streptomyces]MYW69258.1 NarK family nitrate/nitrite MFS transporter [Streptomyces sp. SID8379]
MSPAVRDAAEVDDVTSSYDPRQYRPGRSISDWEPENELFWKSIGKRVATRNLWIAVPALLVAFVVWQVWSVTATNLTDVGFSYSTSQLFWLTAVPGLTGGTARIFYTFLGPRIGQRRFTALSTLVLVVPLLWLGFAVQDTSTPYAVMVAIAALCGIGGANFASSLANIGFFFPKREKGSATGINGGLGNLGVSVVQLLTPIVITSSVLAVGSAQHKADGTPVYLQNAAFLWVPVLLVLAVIAWFGQNDLKVASTPFKQQKVIFKRKHNWLMTWLYVGTFGSFIGFAAALPMLIKTTWTPIDAAYTAATYAWIGPAIGALARWGGGWIADKWGGARVTIVSFVGMAAAIIGVIGFMPSNGAGGSFWGFLICFYLAFFFSGIGNGSTFRQIPVIFRGQHLKGLTEGTPEYTKALKQSEMESGAVTGFTSAIAAYGFFFIPAMFANFAVTSALWCFVGFYATCVVVCWWFYARKGAESPS